MLTSEAAAQGHRLEAERASDRRATRKGRTLLGGIGTAASEARLDRSRRGSASSSLVWFESKRGRRGRRVGVVGARATTSIGADARGSAIIRVRSGRIQGSRATSRFAVGVGGDRDGGRACFELDKGVSEEVRDCSNEGNRLCLGGSARGGCNRRLELLLLRGVVDALLLLLVSRGDGR